MPQMTKAKDLLPGVGEIRMEVPYWSPIKGELGKQQCIVTEVNERGLWYRVLFIRIGLYECFKVPVLRMEEYGGLRC